MTTTEQRRTDQLGISVSLIVRAVIVFLCALVAFWPALHGAWLWDDRADISENPFLRNLAGLVKIWSQPQLLYDFYPLKYTIQWLEWQLWGDNPTPFHFVTLGLHLAGAFLFWRILAQLGVKLAWVGALLFAIHPITVESVAWNAELKNTLSLPPLLLALSLFIEFSERGGRWRYWIALLLYLLSMLCKSSGAPLPIFLAVYLWWRHGRIQKKDIEKVLPFLIIAVALSVVTIWFQKVRGMGSTPVVLTNVERVTLVCSTWFSYLINCLWPIRPLPLYPQWDANVPGVARCIPLIVTIPTIIALARRRTSASRVILLGLSWFALFLLPASGLLAISYFRFTWVMDHMAYVSLLGVIALFVVGASVLIAKTHGVQRYAVYAFVSVVGLLFTARTRAYAAMFASEEALWTYTLQHNPDAWMAHNNLGVLIGRKGNHDAELEHYKTALRLHPAYPEAHKNYGDWLFERGNLDESLSHYQAAIKLKPDYAEAYAGLGNLLRKVGRPVDALPLFQRSLQLDPDDVVARNQYALTLSDVGRDAEARENYELCFLVEPNNSDVHNNLASLLRKKGEIADALRHFEKAIAAKPESPEYRYNYGNALQAAGRHLDAIREYREAIRLKPDFARAMYNLGISLFYSGQRESAKSEIERARKIDSQLAPVEF